MSNLSTLFVYKITDSQSQAQVSVLVLREKYGDRYLPIVIGTNESQSIFLALEKIPIPRPLTHDLFVNFMNFTKCSLKQVVIYKFFDSIYYARLDFLNSHHENFSLDARTSDAIAIALRCEVPIYAEETVLQEAGINDLEIAAAFETDESNINPHASPEFLHFDDDDLNDLLQEAIDDEDYERATQIRDEIKRRKGENPQEV